MIRYNIGDLIIDNSDQSHGIITKISKDQGSTLYHVEWFNAKTCTFSEERDGSLEQYEHYSNN